MKKTLAMIMAIVALAVLAGCGGGGGGVSSTTPSVQSGHGRAAFELHFSGRSAGREAEAATGTVSITVTVTGDYSEDDSTFPPVTATTEIDASGGHGTVSMLEIPIGVNHLMTAVATWQDGYSDTIKYIIPEIKEGEITRGTADYRTTIIADAAIALADRDKIKLSKVTQSRIDTLAAAVDAFLAAGYAADDININDVLDYETTGAVVTTIDVTPATASVTIGETAQFTAAPKNEYGIEITATVTWSVTGGIGSVDSTGLFTASTAGSGTVVATSGTVSGSAEVTVSSAGPVCGNSVVEAGEDCDDGNTVTETCAYGETSCTVCDSVCAEVAGATSYCGDGTTDGTNGETCDDGANNGEPLYCNATCDGITGSVCGNSVVEAGEDCDDGNTVTEECAYGETSCTVCDSSCAEVAGATSYCGDGTTDGTNGETCDDGANNGQPNYCNATCDGTTASVCGNSVIESGEQCDDGNTTSGDGCSSTCQNDAMDTNAWLTIPAGDFVMGCAAADGNCDADESPKHTVTLSEYKIQKYEVTNAQYAACVTAAACTAPSSSDSYTRSPYYGNATYDNYPVIYVNWTQAGEYCAWIGGRLPTEAEWEKAARGAYPAEPIYPWGDGAADCTLANYSGCTGDTDEVGSHPTGASSYGVMDLAGNVWEWVNDWYASDYYTTGGPPWTDPQGPGTGSNRVVRGGAWGGSATRLRASDRVDHLPTSSDYYLGFRCAQDWDVSGPECGNGTLEQGETCDDGANNGQEGYCNATCDGTVDTTPPVQSAWNPAKGATITTTSPTITFTTDENADCKWSLTDDAYGDMAGDCTGDGTTSQSCAVTGLSEGAEIVYIACRDTALNADTIATNEHIDYTVDTTPPVQSAWNPAKSATITTTSPTITFTTDENADCKWSLTDQAYGDMAGDCTGDGTTSISCAVSGLSEGAEMVYVACADTLANKDSAATNEDIDYTVDTITNNAWITIPAGDFVMGCAAADGSCNGDGREEPKHTVTLSEYKIQKYEVTNAQYAACVTAAACTAPSSSDSQTRSPYYGNATYDNYPVIYVNWTQAGEYCAWIGGRLPTEAEWEKAARGAYPAEPIYPWGDGAADCTLVNYSGCTGDTDEVGSHPTGASTYGVMDLAGNVWEWVNDWYASDYYTTGGPPWTDPQGPGTGSTRVVRGGSWYINASYLRASLRGNYNPAATSLNCLGFRCAQD